MKMMHGALVFACSKRSRTRAAPTPTNISTNSEPLIEKNGTLGLAGDRAREQRLAGAGRADQQHALRDLRRRGAGSARASSGSSRPRRSSAFASSMPATSSKRTLMSCSL